MRVLLSCVLLSVLPMVVFSFHASWETGVKKLTWHEAERYCSNRGQKMVSLDTVEKARKFLGLLTKSGKPYFWTGGRLDGGIHRVTWPSGASDSVVRGRYPWSSSGLHGPQPDGGGAEQCVAVLNIAFYKDGAKLHDIGCDHKKPVVCE
jgi:hypothetical protein